MTDDQEDEALGRLMDSIPPAVFDDVGDDVPIGDIVLLAATDEFPADKIQRLVNGRTRRSRERYLRREAFVKELRRLVEDGSTTGKAKVSALRRLCERERRGTLRDWAWLLSYSLGSTTDGSWRLSSGDGWDLSYLPHLSDGEMHEWAKAAFLCSFEDFARIAPEVRRWRPGWVCVHTPIIEEG